MTFTYESREIGLTNYVCDIQVKQPDIEALVISLPEAGRKAVEQFLFDALPRGKFGTFAIMGIRILERCQTDNMETFLEKMISSCSSKTCRVWMDFVLLERMIAWREKQS